MLLFFRNNDGPSPAIRNNDGTAPAIKNNDGHAIRKKIGPAPTIAPVGNPW